MKIIQLDKENKVRKRNSKTIVNSIKFKWFACFCFLFFLYCLLNKLLRFYFLFFCVVRFLAVVSWHVLTSFGNRNMSTRKYVNEPICFYKYPKYLSSIYYTGSTIWITVKGIRFNVTIMAHCKCDAKQWRWWWRLGSQTCEMRTSCLSSLYSLVIMPLPINVTFQTV